MKQWELEFNKLSSYLKGLDPETRTAWMCDHADCEECPLQGEKKCFDSMVKFMESEVK